MPRFGEDVRNVTLIVGSAAVGLAATAALFAGARSTARVVRVAPVVDVRVDRVVVPRVVEAPVVVTSGAERLYGTVETRDGERVSGFLRWDRNEGSWADLLDAQKRSGENRVVTETGIRFGHVAAIERLDSRSARVETRSGDVFELSGASTDLGTGLRALLVESLDGRVAQFDWNDLREVRFDAAPADARSTEQRLHGTVETDAGQTFTGFVSWDIDEIYASDVLDGEVRGRDIDIPFGAIASIERRGTSGVEVTLLDGEVLHLTGSDDVNAGNAGITVSDPGLGQVKISFRDFRSVSFFPPESEPAREAFRGDGRVVGTVIGSTGDSWTGPVTWDADEQWGWEILNGERADAEFYVEFGQVRRIEKTLDGARITLRDGRSLDLGNSQDVGRGNRGITVDTPDGPRTLSWSEFRELRIDD